MIETWKEMLLRILGTRIDALILRARPLDIEQKERLAFWLAGAAETLRATAEKQRRYEEARDDLGQNLVVSDVDGVVGGAGSPAVPSPSQTPRQFHRA